MSDIALTGSDIHSFGMSDIFSFGKCFGSLTAFSLRSEWNFPFDEKFSDFAVVRRFYEVNADEIP